MKQLKLRLYNLIREDDVNDLASNIVDGSILLMIVLNVMLLILDTFEGMPSWYTSMSSGIELFSVIFFTVEYAARVWTADLKFPELTPARARWRHATSFMALIDLFAILPFYLPFVFPLDLRVLRILRVLRLFRLFKVNRYTSAFQTISAVFRRKAHQLISSMVVVGLLMVIMSLLMYNVEHEAQPEVFRNAFSGLWWAVATLTTVGYGDIYPITTLGRLFSGCIAILGIGLVAVPTGIISAGFMEAVDAEANEDSEKDDKKFCPYCGHEIEK